jgi:excisionase family DNA binding protein
MEAERQYSSAEAGVALGVSSQTIRQWVEEGRLQAEFIGLRRILRIDEAELRRFASEHQVRFKPKPQ